MDNSTREKQRRRRIDRKGKERDTCFDICMEYIARKDKDVYRERKGKEKEKEKPLVRI